MISSDILGLSEDLPARVISDEGMRLVEKPVASEYPLTIILNGQELATLLCSPVALEELTAGFLSSEKFISSLAEIKTLAVDYERGVARLETIHPIEVTQDVLFKRLISTGCGRGAAFYSAIDTADTVVSSQVTLTSREIFTMVRTFQHASLVYMKTHGVHSAALCDGQGILLYAEDIGRHNAIDKVFGRALLENLNAEGRIIVTSGRVSSEIAHKASKKRIPIIISISAPTTLAVEAADNLGITLVALARVGSIHVFTHEKRIRYE
jgi:FdhD protein